ncbi:MAG: TolC family protein, partial [Sulfuricurvum sp.]
MKIHYFLLSVLLPTSIYAVERSLLSPEKQSYYEQQQRQIDAGSEKLRTDWISPLNLKALTFYEKSSAGTQDTSQSISAGVAQDIFRSGGITYAIGYADAKKEADIVGMQKEIAGIYQELIFAVLSYRKNALILEQSEIKLKNAKIEIFLKRKQYEAGDIDITLLNNALVNQSSELKNNTAIRFALSQQHLEAAKFSDRSIDTINLPAFALIQKDEFLVEGWNIRYADSLSQTTAQQYGQTKSAYLPKLTLIADAGVQRYDSREFADYHGNFYDMGLQLTIPLTYNATATVQEVQSTYLKQQAQTADLKRQMSAQYDQSIAHIESYQR